MQNFAKDRRKNNIFHQKIKRKRNMKEGSGLKKNLNFFKISGEKHEFSQRILGKYKFYQRIVAKT